MQRMLCVGLRMLPAMALRLLWKALARWQRVGV
jgi:hypothetical protein